MTADLLALSRTRALIKLTKQEFNLMLENERQHLLNSGMLAIANSKGSVNAVQIAVSITMEGSSYKNKSCYLPNNLLGNILEM
jgi:hypothetical protein